MKEDIFAFEDKETIRKNFNLSSSSHLIKSYKIIKPKLNDDENIELIGSGIKKNLIYSLLCMNSKMQNTTLLIDEVVNNLSLNKIELILTKILSNNYNQIILSTHSPIVMNILAKTKFEETEFIFTEENEDNKNQNFVINCLLLDLFSFIT
ncbi:AAA family ATPase [Mesoplasma melaleucae]|uniref:ATPase AAA-type core domain-containing protein n=1 Tax=Mesoplasma melaleucae TaxID=81459 RepID=A0A2K8NZS4_9MOLU|nr:AAA family ATPase [Mesoplasma melaleucae]ATZ18143.1 hypothetical protein EMELA_v1c06360 [Mesoplasma melaleucae]